MSRITPMLGSTVDDMETSSSMVLSRYSEPFTTVIWSLSVQKS